MMVMVATNSNGMTHYLAGGVRLAGVQSGVIMQSL